jgi:filamentous hemagglutinin family protein
MALQIESAWALPQGGQVVSGQADIVNVSANELQIRQASQRAVIDWQSFDIGANEAVHILQVDDLAQTLNRVVGAAGATEIFGTLSANGTVILTNAAGFLFGPHAALDVHALVVTTADIGNEEFMNDTDGVLHFDLGSEVLNAGIVNQSTITAAEGGLVSFVAPSVQNQGLIRARLGKIELASANTFTLDLYGDELIQLGVDDRVLRDVTGLDGEVLSAAVANSGSLMADGGQVIISAEAARDVVNQVVNLSGVVQARSVDEQEGKIVLRAGDYGTVALSGRLDVSSATGAARAH